VDGFQIRLIRDPHEQLSNSQTEGDVHRTSLIAISVIAFATQGCRDSRAETPPRPRAAAPQDLAGRFVSHAEHIQPGMVKPFAGLQLRNPHEGDATAVATGAKLFIAYNCIDCHGADGSGAMGPSLADGRWHFGGAPAEVFESIYQGRPEGMPAWGSLISEDQVWLLVTYVRSLSANKDVTTENFGGKTVERTGH